MSQGIITRIGQWIDSKFEEKVSRAEFENLKSHTWIGPKEFDELKGRVERIEIYMGMKRVIDVGKPAVEKSAFTM